ncbi:MAG: TetR/AcrR family transcriptional regulator [Acetobacteraceae bacterium]
MREHNHRGTETRQRILDAAGVLFRRHGIDRVGVDAIMHQAGLTHGGFYAHFESKEALVAEVAAATLARSAARWDRISQEPDHADALKRIVDPYLDPAHVAAAGQGCILPSLGAEVARRPEVLPAIGDSIRTMVDALHRCRPEDPPDRALASLSCMVGAVLLARLTNDPALAGQFLDAARAEASREPPPA